MMSQRSTAADALLASYLLAHASEASRLGPLLAARPLAEAALQRTSFPGHITASAFVVAQSTGRVLLIAHKRLGRLLQPGGHVEASDEGLREAAAREAREETGVRVDACAGVLVDIDVHTIPAGRGSSGMAEPAHDHYDFRFLFVVPNEAALLAQEAEVHGCMWVSLASAEALAALGERSVRAVRTGLEGRGGEQADEDTGDTPCVSVVREGLRAANEG
jgi:8-oxo-dGTP pyrophosphatase MutT (NUDIX family)